jgi:TonB-linked SusC/RagA family outer membrane protein
MKRILLAIILSMSCTFIYAQIKVSGTVRSASDNEVLPGANVIVKGTTTGTITNANGEYQLEIPSADAVLVYSFIGFQTQEVAVAGRSVVNVSLETDAFSLDDVVVVGYGVQKKSDVTGSIVSVEADKLRDVPSSSLTKALQGKTAGVEIVNTSRRPGGDTQIRIRGNRSLTASNDPLIIVDGIPFGGKISDIASDDIQSMEILKDASATVIYGSRGANGVIIITTKRGKLGDLKISYNGYQGITQVARKYDIYDAEGFVKLRRDAGNYSYLPDETESMLSGRETDWQDLIYQTGITSNHEMSLSGGSETTQYSFTGGYYNETGILPAMGFKRYNMRLALDQQIGKRIKIGITTMNSLSITDGQSANPMFQVLALSPLAKPYNDDGTVNEIPQSPNEDWYNPLTIKDSERWKEQDRRAASFNTLYAEVKILEGLKYRMNFGFEYGASKYNNFYGSNTVFRAGKQNQARIKHTDDQSYTIENLLIYDKTIGRHRINFTGMQSAQESLSVGSRIDAIGIPADYIQYYDFSLAENVSVPENDNFYTKWNLLSYMARVNYAFDDKYLLTVTGRSDGSSRFAEGYKWHTYPAFALGWNIGREAFMENVDFVSNLKLRAGYGQTSNTSVPPYSTLGGLTLTYYNYGSQGVKGYYVSTLPNKTLGWEFTTTYNAGLDFSFLNDRISGSVDAYLQKTNDLLLGKKLPPSQGVPGMFLENIGKTENRGLEIALNGVIMDAANDDEFFWEMNVNLFLNREKIVELQDKSISQDIENGWFVGHPSSAIYDWEKIGIWQLGEETQAAIYGKKPGDIKLKDQDGDNDIDDNDRVILGSSQPDLMGGFTSTWGYKRFDLSVVGYFRVGGTIASTLHMPNNYLNRLDGRRNQIVVDYWTPENPTNDMPKPSATIDASRSDVLGYFDGSFLKIRSINLGYNFNPALTSRIFGEGSSVRVYASLADAFIFFSPYLKAGGVDPEPTNTAVDDIEGISLPDRTLVVGYNTPPTSKLLFGVNIKF